MNAWIIEVYRSKPNTHSPKEGYWFVRVKHPIDSRSVETPIGAAAAHALIGMGADHLPDGGGL